MNVTFIGLGAIGRPMARRIADAGIPLTVWNRTGERAAKFASATGAVHASSIVDAVREADVVITCLSTSASLQSLLDMQDGLITGMRGGSVLVDCTSGDPATSKLIAERLRPHDIGFLDAPVSGGTSGAENGTLTVMVGGRAELLERVRPVLQAFAKKIVHCGEVGAGDALKAVNNTLLAVNIWAAAEGLALLIKAGVAPQVALDVINASSGKSNVSENLFASRVLTREFPRTFRLALLDKDVGIAANVARQNRIPVPLLQLVSELLGIAHNELGDDADHMEAVKIVEHWAGVEIE